MIKHDVMVSSSTNPNRHVSDDMQLTPFHSSLSTNMKPSIMSTTSNVEKLNTEYKANLDSDFLRRDNVGVVMTGDVIMNPTHAKI